MSGKDREVGIVSLIISSRKGLSMHYSPSMTQSFFRITSFNKKKRREKKCFTIKFNRSPFIDRSRYLHFDYKDGHY